MKKTYITPESYALKIGIENFKIWLLKEYRVPWHVLDNTALQGALDWYNTTHRLTVKKFWD